jgi:hypothetical protein
MTKIKKETAKTKQLAGNRSQADWRQVLFRSNQLVGFKEEVTSQRLLPVATDRTEFYVLNPLHNLRSAFDANVASFQNILIELDWRGLQAQEKQVEQVLQMPFTMKTYSGAKSLHYVIALAQPVAIEEWREMVAFLLFAIKKADAQCKNPARLTRTPGVMRASTGNLQRLIHLEGAPMPTEEFRRYLNTGQMAFERVAWDLKREHERAARAAQRERALITGEPPPWVKELLADPTKRVIQGSRHATMIKVAVTLYSLGFDVESYIEPRLVALAAALDKSDQEVYSILNWVERNIQLGGDGANVD